MTSDQKVGFESLQARTTLAKCRYVALILSSHGAKIAARDVFKQPHDPASLIDTRCATFGADVPNYVGCSPGPACDYNGGLLDLASPYRRFTKSSSPVFIVASNLDPMPPNQFTILVNLVAAIGVPNHEHSLIIQTPGPDGCTGHSFDLWPDVSDEAIAFLNAFLQVPTTSVPANE